MYIYFLNIRSEQIILEILLNSYHNHDAHCWKCEITKSNNN